MAPASRAVQLYEVGEKVLCYHGPVMYESKILEVGHVDPDNKKSPYSYFVHYQGWKNTWDDWVEDDRLRKASTENREQMKNQHASARNQQRREVDAKKAASKKQSTAGLTSKRKSQVGADLASSVRASEERSSSVMTPAPRGTKRARDWELEKESDFLTKPAIRIPLPDSLKRLLVDDWEFVTKDLTLVPIPHPHPVSEILLDYTAFEAPRRRPGSAEADVLEEVVQGVREYFDKSLGRILLYRFERQQWLENTTAMNKDASDPTAERSITIPAREGEEEVTIVRNLAGKTSSEVYGPEHLARLFVSMPELIAQTNMDSQSINRLREELNSLTSWLGKHSKKYFATSYVDPGDRYKISAKGAA